MQTADSDSQNLRDEEHINFRPSPNFKHMKKYLKRKFEEDSGIFEQQKENKNLMSVQPPLPPNSPPPDSPPGLVLKQEIEEDDSQSNMEDSNEDILPEYQVLDKSDETVGSPKKPKPTMCRNFVRGTCIKGAACIFSHILDISQLKGVYTFCKNFQNRVCKKPDCKFVHASVFEKEKFYRTGYLPPHTLAHLKKNPGPPLPPPEETQVEVAPMFTVPPPVSLQTNVPALTILSAPIVNDSSSDIFRGTSPSYSPSKCDWINIEKFSRFPCDSSDSSEPLVKKCKHCDNNEFRLEYNKKKVKKIKQSSEDRDKKINLLFKKNDKLYLMLHTLYKYMNAVSQHGAMSLSLSEDKEKKMEQLRIYLSSNTKPPPSLPEDSVKALGRKDNFTKLLSIFLLGSDQVTQEVL